MKKVLTTLAIICSLFLTGCEIGTGDKYEAVNKSDKEYKNSIEMTYSDYQKKVDSKETFAFLIYQTGCSHCAEFEPKLNKLIDKYNLEIYSLNLANLTDSEYEKLKNKTFVSGTPTTVFIKNGKYEEKLAGNKEESEIINFLIEIEYLKEK